MKSSATQPAIQLRELDSTTMLRYVVAQEGTPVCKAMML